MTRGTPAPVTLAHLTWGWGSAYAIGYRGDQWLAARRDGAGVLAAGTLAGLQTVIEADYRHQPVPREFDPPGSSTRDDQDEDGDRPSEDESFLLAAMQAAFPAWAISYSSQARAWIARTRRKTICQGSAVVLCAALLRAERRYRQHTTGPGTGMIWPPGGGPSDP